MGVCWLAARGAVAEAPRLAEAWQGCVDWLKAVFHAGERDRGTFPVPRSMA